MKFLCYWGKGYYGKDNPHKKPFTEIHTLEWFTEDNGYSAKDAYDLTYLAVDGVKDFTDFLGQEHYVKRIE